MQMSDPSDDELDLDLVDVDEDGPDAKVDRWQPLLVSTPFGSQPVGDARPSTGGDRLTQKGRALATVLAEGNRRRTKIAPMADGGTDNATGLVGRVRQPTVERTIREAAREEGLKHRESNAGTSQRPIKWIRPDKFMVSTPIHRIKSYLSHFDTVAEYNQWTERDKLAHLKAPLTGDAAQLLWDSGCHAAISYDELITKLKARFGSADKRFACQLRSLKRQQLQQLYNEVRRLLALVYPDTLQQLYNEVRRLLALVYPDASNSSLGEIIARDAFLSALNDRELEIKVRDREPPDLDSAFRAMRIETYLRPTETSTSKEFRDRHDGHRARQLKEPPGIELGETAIMMREMRDQQIDRRECKRS
jgi:hypothetical protein